MCMHSTPAARLALGESNSISEREFVEVAERNWRCRNKFSWQEGYGAFSVSASQTANVVRYIENQAAHHTNKSFEDEFVEFLFRYGVAYNPAHVLG